MQNLHRFVVNCVQFCETFLKHTQIISSQA